MPGRKRPTEKHGELLERQTQAEASQQRAWRRVGEGEGQGKEREERSMTKCEGG